MSWNRWKPTARQPWNIRRVVHLHRRAGFGTSWERIQRDLRDGHHAAIGRVLAALGDAAEIDQLSASLGDAAVGSNRPERLQAWWLRRMLKSPYPLREKLTLMWHNHFAVSNEKVANLAAMKRQNERLYRCAAGRFADLLNSMATDPAMLVWLDAPSNRKGHPNENLSREVMELFTLGIGNYSERDVREAARALTGWGINDEGEFAFFNHQHDQGSKSILGQTGRWNGDDLLRILLEQSAVSDRIAWRLCDTFMGEGVVDPEARKQLAGMLRKNNLHIGKAVETIIHSELFFADENIGGRVAGPVEFVVSSVRALDCLQPDTVKLGSWTRELGQDLFYPPNVGGWSGGRNWLSSRYIVGRANFAAALSDGQIGKRRTTPDFVGMVRRHCAGTAKLEVAVPFLCELILGNRLSPKLNDRMIATLRERPEGLGRQLQLAVSLILSLPRAQQG